MFTLRKCERSFPNPTASMPRDVYREHPRYAGQSRFPRNRSCTKTGFCASRQQMPELSLFRKRSTPVRAKGNPGAVLQRKDLARTTRCGYASSAPAGTASKPVPETPGRPRFQLIANDGLTTPCRVPFPGCRSLWPHARNSAIGKVVVRCGYVSDLSAARRSCLRGSDRRICCVLVRRKRWRGSDIDWRSADWVCYTVGVGVLRDIRLIFHCVASPNFENPKIVESGNLSRAYSWWACQALQIVDNFFTCT